MSTALEGIKRVKMNFWDAKAAQREYLKAAELHPEIEEYKHVAAAAQCIKEHGEVIHLGQALAAGGLNEWRVPRLAIVRADAREVMYERTLYNDTQTFSMVRGERGLRGKPKNLTFGLGLIPGDTGTTNPPSAVFRAIVPLIPPRLLPRYGLHNYFILWEATWARVAPHDPILLRHVSGMFYQPMAQWDLTELEQLVLTTRLTRLGTNMNVPIGGE